MNWLHLIVTCYAAAISFAMAQTVEANYTSPVGVNIYNPDESFASNGPWSLMSKAGNTLYIAGKMSTSNARYAMLTTI